MSDGLLFFLLKQVFFLGLTALVFFWLGWWLRRRGGSHTTAHAAPSHSFVSAETSDKDKERLRTLESKVQAAEERARAAEKNLAAARDEAAAALKGMVPAAQLEAAQNSLIEAKRISAEHKATLQRSEDGFKAFRNAEARILELQNELARSREEAARLRDAQLNVSQSRTDSEAELARMKDTVRTAEGLAGQERRRADELQRQITTLGEQLQKAKDDLASAKALAVTPEIRSRMESDLATARDAKKATDEALKTERNRNMVLDREYNHLKGQLSTCRVDTGKLQAEVNRLEEALRQAKQEAAASTSASTVAPAATLAAAAVALAPVEEEPTPAPAPEPAISAPLPIASLAPLQDEPAPVTTEEPAPEAAPEAEVPATKKEKIEIATEVLGKRVVSDDFKIVEGIGPKIEELIHEDGITTWAQLSTASVDRLKDILNRAGERFTMHDPTTWPQQATLAFEEKWQELRALQDKLDGGRIVE